MRARWISGIAAIGALAGCGESEPAGDPIDAGGEVDAEAGAIDAALDGAAPDTAIPPDAPADAHAWVGAGAFGGSWLCQYSATTVFTAPIAQTVMSTGVDYVSITDGTASDLQIAVDGPTGACTFAADRAGSSATLRAGQTCVRVTSGVTVTFTLASGAGDAAAGTVLLDLAGSIGGSMGSGQVAGQLTTQYQCLMI